MPATLSAAILLAALAYPAAASEMEACTEGSIQGTCSNAMAPPNAKTSAASGLGLLQFSHLSGRVSEAPAEEGKEEKKEEKKEEAKEDKKEAKEEGEAASDNAANVSNATNTTANASNEDTNATQAVSVSGCVTKKDPRAHAWFAETAPEGTPCVFGADVRDEGSHCIFDEGMYGSNGWCFTAADGSAWGSCNEDCPLYGQGAQLGKKIDTVAKVIKTVKKKLMGETDDIAKDEEKEAADKESAN